LSEGRVVSVGRKKQSLDDGRCNDMANLATCPATEFELAVTQYTLLP
jgi:hypothetical protein